MSNHSAVDLRKAIQTQNAFVKYQDEMYMSLINQLNTQCQDILKDDLGSQFVKSCGRDLAGEVIRNFLDTSDFHITVDQLAERIIKFKYDNEYDPLKDNSQLQKNVYNYGEITSKRLNEITVDMDKNQQALFPEARKDDKNDQKARQDFRDKRRAQDPNGDLHDDLTGIKEEKKTQNRNGKDVDVSDIHADHIQARAAAQYNSRYISTDGIHKLKDFYYSADNLQLLHASANTSKGDVRVCEINGKIKYLTPKDADYKKEYDITHRATPDQLTEAFVKRLESGDPNSDKIRKLKEKGYLNEDGTVPKHIKDRYLKNIKYSQNKESLIILETLEYNVVAKDALSHTAKSAWKILAGQVIYYTAPPLMYEVRVIIQNKPSSIDNALESLANSAKRIGKYVHSKLKDILGNALYNSFKNFIKIFMDILINLVKATVKKLLKIAKSLILSVVDSVKILATKGTSAAQKADAVCNLFGVTITNIAVETLFEVIEHGLHIPEPLLMPMQILTSVVCTNSTMLILQKADLFDVRYGFKINAIRDLFEKTQQEFDKKSALARNYTFSEIENMITQAKIDTLEIYHRLTESNMFENEVRGDLEKINQMFNMGIDFEKDWRAFSGGLLLPEAI